MPILQASKVIETLKLVSTNVSDYREQLLQITADQVRATGKPYTSVYLYMLQGDELVLEAFSGRETDHKRIKVGQGVCGTAVAESRDQNVPDVTVRVNYIACNLFTRSELVVLIRKNGEILGQIDIDSDVVSAFTEEEEAALKRVGDTLGDLL